jgi:multidrug efflux pump subunit AcrB
MTTLDTEQAISLDVGLELATKKRKRQDDPDRLPKLYDIIPSKQPSSLTGLMASEKIYSLSSISSSNHKDDVTVSLDPSSLDTYGTAVQAMYDQAQKEHQPQGAGDQSLKTMVADHARRQAKKKRHLEIRNIEKKKDFKF